MHRPPTDVPSAVSLQLAGQFARATETADHQPSLAYQLKNRRRMTVMVGAVITSHCRPVMAPALTSDVSTSCGGQ